ncbi:MAG: glycosyltransferase family 2 protein, partial [Candidatus Marinimicrobia bacterium]|nr:glycosyltransferase family 2 protein [Candidatus Neomarinimicrobiota bacterium]
MTILVQLLEMLLNGFNYLVLVYFLSLNFFYLLTTILAFFALRTYARRMEAVDLQSLIAKAGVPP